LKLEGSTMERHDVLARAEAHATVMSLVVV
jgi:hypothetical protein